MLGKPLDDSRYCKFCIFAKFGIFVDKDHSKLRTLYWLPKLHKRPYKSRFIANLSFNFDLLPFCD